MSPRLPPSRPRRRAAFSLIELVIVVVIIGTIASIAVPRLLSASERSTDAAVLADRTTLQRAIDLYIAEHAERCPATQPGGAVSTDAAAFEHRLTGKTQISGLVDASGGYGPYLRELPVNPRNGLATVRINGAAPGANTHGWRYDSAAHEIQPDHAKIVIEGEEVVGAPGGKLGGGGAAEDAMELK